MNHREVMQQALDYIVTTNKSSQFWLVPNSNLNKTVATLRAALAEPQEPASFLRERAKLEQEWYDLKRLQAQYKQPQRQPLTEEEIKRCERYMSVFGANTFEQLVYFARAIEKAHGIGVQDE